MLVVALQFYPGDWFRAMRLADFLLYLEKRANRHRDDVLLLFVHTCEMPVTRLVDDTISRCSEVFRTERLILRPDTAERGERWGELNSWPVGPNVLWQGTVDYFMTEMGPEWGTLFAVDGGDSAPLCADWVDVLVGDHARTLGGGKQVTGWVQKDGLGRWHANLNALYERSFFEQHPEMRDMPSGADLHEPVDMYRRELVLSACRASTAIYSSWRMLGAGPGHFAEVAKQSAWWHGCRDGDFVDKARAFVDKSLPEFMPQVVDLGAAVDLVAGGR